MKNFILLALFVGQSFAAVNNNTQRELEILSLPYQNQLSTFKNDQQTYNNLLAIAKDARIGFSKRWKAIVALSELRKDQSLDDLKTLSLSKEWFIKNAVLVSLQNIRSPQKMEITKRLLKDSSLVVRSAAVDQLIYEGVDAHRDLLWEELFHERNKKKNQSLWIRNQIIKALAQNPKPLERSLFLKLLNEKESEIVNSSLKGAQKLVLSQQEINSLTKEKMEAKVSLVKSKLTALN